MSQRHRFTVEEGAIFRMWAAQQIGEKLRKRTITNSPGKIGIGLIKKEPHLHAALSLLPSWKTSKSHIITYESRQNYLVFILISMPITTISDCPSPAFLFTKTRYTSWGVPS